MSSISRKTKPAYVAIEPKLLHNVDANLRQAAASLSGLLRGKPGFVAVAVSRVRRTDQLQVLLESDVVETRKAIPASYEGFPVDVIITGKIEAF